MDKRTTTRRGWPLLFSLLVSVTGGCGIPGEELPVEKGAVMSGTPKGKAVIGSDAKPFTQTIPRSAVTIEMVPVPAGQTLVADGDISRPLASPSGFYMGSTELPWEAFDVFVLRLDERQPGTGDSSKNPDVVDAISRPSEPYVLADRGFGHDGYPVISVSFSAAQNFCAWMSAHTGLSWRLPTEEEFLYAGAAGATYDGIDPEKLGQWAWFDGNGDGTTHPCGTLTSNSLGLFDLRGNVTEWCTDSEGLGITMGGSYLESAEDTRLASIQREDSSWNMSDPNIPKSPWWYADASWVGFRLVCENPPSQE
ncbi:MAG: SUMF1/EgtB/PvdO family nonheme iron enzyme [Planctomycetota bacterium]|nr:SUMF1/EgtB/PvdO family nonheme iron enzyme [Planctomycetota bacterium]